MRTASAKQIFDGIASRFGKTELTAQDRQFVGQLLDSERVTELWEYANWRELDVVEERFYYADYAGGTTYATGAIVYYPTEETYYQALQESTGNLPTDTDYWEEATDFETIVDFVQAGKTPIGIVNAVTLEDPRLVPNSARVDFVRREDALQVVAVDQVSVWVRFTRREPRITGAAYSAETAYVTGDVVYDATTGGCYQALQGSTGQAVTAEAYWQLQEIPHFGLNFLIRAGLADLYDSKDQPEKAGRQEAKAEDCLADAYHVQQREGQLQRMEVQSGDWGC